MKESDYEVKKITHKDGSFISYRQLGNGPGLVVIPGVLSTAANYMVLARELAKQFSIYIVDRRGRGESAPQDEYYSMAMECDDIEAILKETHARFVFGHSYGGLVALEAARRGAPIAKLAVYEPGVSVDGGISVGWIPSYREKLAKKKHLDAFAEFAIATGPKQAQAVPFWLMKIILRAAIRKRERQEMFALLDSNAKEHQVVADLNDTYQNYEAISQPLLFLTGSKSNLKWLPGTMAALKQAVPHIEIRTFSKLDHFGPDKSGPQVVAGVLLSFFVR